MASAFCIDANTGAKQVWASGDLPNANVDIQLDETRKQLAELKNNRCDAAPASAPALCLHTLFNSLVLALALAYTRLRILDSIASIAPAADLGPCIYSAPVDPPALQRVRPAP